MPNDLKECINLMNKETENVLKEQMAFLEQKNTFEMKKKSLNRLNNILNPSEKKINELDITVKYIQTKVWRVKRLKKYFGSHVTCGTIISDLIYVSYLRSKTERILKGQKKKKHREK